MSSPFSLFLFSHHGRNKISCAGAANTEQTLKGTLSVWSETGTKQNREWIREAIGSNLPVLLVACFADNLNNFSHSGGSVTKGTYSRADPIIASCNKIWFVDHPAQTMFLVALFKNGTLFCLSGKYVVVSLRKLVD